MAFPTVAGVATRTESADSTSHTIPVDSAPSAGDGLLCLVAIDGGSAVVPSWPAGFTEAKRNDSTTDFSVFWLWKTAAGSEGTSIAFTTDDSEKLCIITWRITGHTAWSTSPPEFGTVATAGATAPDPPSVTATWGSADNLWIVGYGAGQLGPATASPSTFGTLRQVATSGGAAGTNVNLGGAEKNDAVATLNPGTFTRTGSAVWFGETVVIRPTSALAIAPAGPTVAITAGSLAVASVQVLAPTGPTLTVTPGTLAVASVQPITLTGPTLTATAGVVTTGVVQAVTPDSPTVAVTAGAVTVKETLLPDSPTITITPGDVTVDIPLVLAFTALGSIQNTTNVNTFNTTTHGTGPIAASATGNVVIAVVQGSGPSVTSPTAATLANHSALPFALLTATVGTNPSVDTTPGNPSFLGFYGCLATATTSDDVDITFSVPSGLMSGCAVSFVQVTGFATPPASITDAYDQLEIAVFAAATSASLTLDAFASASDAYLLGLTNAAPASEDIIPEAGATEIHDLGYGSPNRSLLTSWKANDTTASATWTTTWSGVAGALVLDSSGAAAALAITPTGPTIAVTAGSLAVTPVQVVVPASATVAINPGSLTVELEALPDQDIAPAAVTVTITTGTVAVAPVQPLIPTAVTVNITAGSLAVVGERAITPVGPTVAITPGVVAVSIATPVQSVVPAAVTLTVTPGDVAIAQDQVLVAAPATVAVTPGELTVAIPLAQFLILSSATLTVTPGTISFTEVHVAREPFVLRWPLTRRGIYTRGGWTRS